MSISWTLYEWQRRNGGKGSPGAAEWSSRNIQVTAEGLVLKLTDPTGAMPVEAEILSEKRGFGYGTYEYVIEKRSPRLPDRSRTTSSAVGLLPFRSVCAFDGPARNGDSLVERPRTVFVDRRAVRRAREP